MFSKSFRVNKYNRARAPYTKRTNFVVNAVRLFLLSPSELRQYAALGKIFNVFFRHMPYNHLINRACAMLYWCRLSASLLTRHKIDFGITGCGIHTLADWPHAVAASKCTLPCSAPL